MTEDKLMSMEKQCAMCKPHDDGWGWWGEWAPISDRWLNEYGNGMTRADDNARRCDNIARHRWHGSPVCNWHYDKFTSTGK